LSPDGQPDSGRRHGDSCPQVHTSLWCTSLGSAAPGG
jgi:hypothetical protein